MPEVGDGVVWIIASKRFTNGSGTSSGWATGFSWGAASTFTWTYAKQMSKAALILLIDFFITIAAFSPNKVIEWFTELLFRFYTDLKALKKSYC